ncbi:basic proline-rich protein-like [Mustela erminea]|uniref:basic proline-rich protein-like n=1 Tax=Mustela erminea TaxID=36723 RepID=UPI001386F6DE|nr:basic proline-rich protein-like [Mustela erminea]
MGTPARRAGRRTPREPPQPRPPPPGAAPTCGSGRCPARPRGRLHAPAPAVTHTVRTQRPPAGRRTGARGVSARLPRHGRPRPCELPSVRTGPVRLRARTPPPGPRATLQPPQGLRDQVTAALRPATTAAPHRPPPAAAQAHRAAASPASRGPASAPAARPSAAHAH